jgi:Tol biopolymer transport system component
MSDPAFSPNSEEIAFVWDGENPVHGDVYVHLIGGEKPLRLTHTESGFTCCASWSPDGHQLAFGRCDDSGGAVFVVPALGGVERKVASVTCIYGNAGWPIWTTDGKSMVIADQCSPKGSIGIVRFSLPTGERQCLSQPEPGDRGDRSLALSPDGHTIAFIRMHSRTVNEICTVPVRGGSTRLITSDGGSFWGLMWSSDGKRIVFRSPRQMVAKPEVIRTPSAIDHENGRSRIADGVTSKRLNNLLNPFRSGLRDILFPAEQCGPPAPRPAGAVDRALHGVA